MTYYFIDKITAIIKRIIKAIIYNVNTSISAICL